ncbi:phytanoyl-CoA dioxygenase family protein [Verticiella sediminum]|uniref:Phytanoyl-CoA dioxygenase family protein n=1 Tax=Verticiella sediminum TaxID=1247510 RepID=A0A556A7C5_9BURK|nr:phytanoyl-CoA dioxygenase family protein [Verticiella sediminum]TSH88788.1 phytanoyl-CoA dioxygenase family protein [Verticiella sediminum]
MTIPDQSAPPLSRRYQELGFEFPIAALSREAAQRYRTRLETSMEAVGGRFKGIYTQKPHLLFKWLAELASEPAILDVVERVIGPDILLWSTEFFIKEPGDERFVPWHVDDTYWHIEPEIQTTVWIALSDVKLENGPLRYIPGSHRQSPLPVATQASPENMLISGQMAQGVDESVAVDVVLQAGEIAVHDSKTLHASGKNTGMDRRIGIAARYLSPQVRSLSSRESALLVRGTDRYGHFDPEPWPAADLDEAARKAHAIAAERRLVNMYGARHQDQPAMR